MISHSEGTDRVKDPYRCCFGFKHIINNLAEHPAISGEWMGESLAFLGPHYAHSVSTAAGRYQITRPTWSGLQTILKLPDFTGPCQDDAAIQLIKENRALDLIFAGRVEDAIALCCRTWASLPGSKSGQPQRQLVDLIDAYGTAGGSFA